MTDAVATRACQFTLAAPCPSPRAAFLLTFRSADGLEWIEAQCRSHCDPRADQVRAEKGRLIAVEALPEPMMSVESMAIASATARAAAASPKRRARARAKVG